MKSSKKNTKPTEKKSFKKEHKSTEKKKKQTAVASVTEIMPFTHLYQQDIPIRKDGVFWEILQVSSKDLLNATETDLEFDNLCFDKLYRTYSGDIKFIGMNFPSDTSKQQEYIKHKISQTTNEVFIYELQDKLQELEWIQQNLTTREYYLIFYSKNLEEYRDNLGIIFRALSSGTTPLVKKISAQKKIEILYKLSNKNSFI